MTIKNDFFIICRDISKDVATDLININGVLEAIKADVVPVSFSPISIVGRFIILDSGKTDSVEFKISIKSPSGEVESPSTDNLQVIPVKPNLPKQYLGVLGSAGTMVFKEFGEYEFSLTIGNEVIATTQIRIEENNAS